MTELFLETQLLKGLLKMKLSFLSALVIGLLSSGSIYAASSSGIDSSVASKSSVKEIVIVNPQLSDKKDTAIKASNHSFTYLAFRLFMGF